MLCFVMGFFICPSYLPYETKCLKLVINNFCKEVTSSFQSGCSGSHVEMTTGRPDLFSMKMCVRDTGCVFAE